MLPFEMFAINGETLSFVTFGEGIFKACQVIENETYVDIFQS